jgi:predicted small secreted protein
MNTKRAKPQAIIILTLLLTAAFLPGCETATGQGAGFGAAAGAILGAAATGHAEGAATGALIGATTGAIIGASVDESRAVRYGAPPQSGFPFGRHTQTPGYYQSPYPPYQVYNLRGIPHGALVDDPVGRGYFRKP